MSVSANAIVPAHAAEGTVPFVVAALFRHYQLLFYTMSFVVAAILCVTLATKREYRSEMKYLVQNNRSTSVISSDRTASSIVNGVTEEQLNSELAILQSEDVLSQVADPSWNPQEASSKTRAQKHAHADKLTKLSARLTVDPVAKDDIMSVNYRADSPQDAYDKLSAISTAYLARHEQLSRPAGASQFFAGQTDTYERGWKEASERLVDFQRQHHLVSVLEVEESLEKSILATEEELRQQQIKVNESDAGIGGAGRILAETPQRQPTQQRLMPSEELLQQLKVTLVGQNNRRTELLTRYQPTDRLVVEVERQIADTKSAIEAEKDKLNIENTTDVNPPWQQINTSLAQERVNRETLRAGMATLQQQLAQLRAQLSETQGLAVDYDQLRSQADQAQVNYKAFVEKRDLAHVEDAMDQNKFLNVAVMESPTLPYTPARPKPLLNLLLGLPTAIFVGLAAVYFAESGRSTFSSPRELDALIDYPVLATIALAPAYGHAAGAAGSSRQ